MNILFNAQGLVARGVNFMAGIAALPQVQGQGWVTKPQRVIVGKSFTLYAVFQLRINESRISARD